MTFGRHWRGSAAGLSPAFAAGVAPPVAGVPGEAAAEAIAADVRDAVAAASAPQPDPFAPMRQFPTGEELTAYLAAVPPVVRAVAHVQMATGLTRAEACSLAWEQVDFDRGAIVVKELGLSAAARSLLLAMREACTSDRWVFPADLGGTGHVSADAITAWEHAGKRATGARWRRLPSRATAPAGTASRAVEVRPEHIASMTLTIRTAQERSGWWLAWCAEAVAIRASDITEESAREGAKAAALAVITHECRGRVPDLIRFKYETTHDPGGQP